MLDFHDALYKGSTQYIDMLGPESCLWWHLFIINPTIKFPFANINQNINHICKLKYQSYLLLHRHQSEHWRNTEVLELKAKVRLERREVSGYPKADKSIRKLLQLYWPGQTTVEQAKLKVIYWCLSLPRLLQIFQSSDSIEISQE